MFESILHSALLAQTKGMLSDTQHGFRPGRSTVNNLITHTDSTLSKVDAGHRVDIAYFDYRKAFDRVNLGFSSYRGNRRQFIRYGSYESMPYFTRFGASQNSTLGPLLFSLLNNNIEYIKYSKCLLFVDDVKIYKSVAGEQDAFLLQSDITSICNFSRKIGLELNNNKCVVMSFDRKSTHYLHNYVIRDDSLKRVNKVKDLVVILNAYHSMNI